MSLLKNLDSHSALWVCVFFGVCILNLSLSSFFVDFPSFTSDPSSLFYNKSPSLGMGAENVDWALTELFVFRLQNIRRTCGKQDPQWNKISLQRFKPLKGLGFMNKTPSLYKDGANCWGSERLLGSHNYCRTLFVFSARETIFLLQYLCPNKIKNLVQDPNSPQRSQLTKIY